MKKNVVALALGGFFLVGSVASATCMTRKVYECRGGSGEMAASFTVNETSCAAPGGPVSRVLSAEASASWFGGTHYSGAVGVVNASLIPEQQTFVNDDAGFELQILEQTRRRLRPFQSMVRATGHFVDPRTGMNGHIVEQWFTCK